MFRWLPCHDSLKVGKKDLKGFSLEWKSLISDFGEKFRDFGSKMRILEYARIMVLSLLGKKLWRIFERFLCDDTSCQKRYKYRATQTRNESFWSFVSSASWYADRR
ncbi:hypothetical protein AVEN_66-1 [Araneus ventricosus]|uniref:Uncharacterized protein n=1 Tax=Araneus ventricosus TaxID=182803 RepID=A0A4Y2KLK8_ARAVE|nr:hypothetical protein AVEN_66-1 [Araneus ventricosus]